MTYEEWATEGERIAFLELRAVLKEADLRYAAQGLPLPMDVRMYISIKVKRLQDAMGITDEQTRLAFGSNYQPTPEDIEDGRLGNVVPFERKP